MVRVTGFIGIKCRQQMLYTRSRKYNNLLGIHGNELPELTIGRICVRFSLVKTDLK